MKALIIGIDGQDGYYLTEFLQKKGYEVYGIVRKKSGIKHNVFDFQTEHQYHQIFADLMDFSSIMNAIEESAPDEIYNFAGQSEIPLSWRQPMITAEVNALGVMRLLEAIRFVNPKIRLFQASSSEMFGRNPNQPLNENSVFMPRNPYGTAKLFAHWCIADYREKYGLFCTSGVLFNHESPRRGVEFVTRKITKAAAAIALGRQEYLELGDLNAVRDWGYAGDYVRAMWMMLQQPEPKDYIIATGVGHTVRDFATYAFEKAGINLTWTGTGFDEVAVDTSNGKTVIRVSQQFYRNQPNDIILADAQKIQNELGFTLEYTFEKMIDMIVQSDIQMLAER